jgi:hypothetical protein
VNQLDEKLAEALEYVRKAEHIMAELGHTKYSLSGMSSAAIRHDLEQEVCQLLSELSAMQKQRDQNHIDELTQKLAEVSNEILNLKHEYNSFRDIIKQDISLSNCLECGKFREHGHKCKI